MRAAITSWLEVAGLVLLAVALGVWVANYTLPGGIAAGGGALLVSSLLIAIRAPKPRAHSDETTA